MSEPNVVRVIEPSGEVDDMIDYIVNNRLAQERGMGYTACQPSLVEITVNGQNVQSIKFGIDNTYVDSETGNVMGYGIVGYVYASVAEDPSQTEIYFITPKDVLEEKIKYIMDNDIDPEVRPRGKY